MAARNNTKAAPVSGRAADKATAVKAAAAQSAETKAAAAKSISAKTAAAKSAAARTAAKKTATKSAAAKTTSAKTAAAKAAATKAAAAKAETKKATLPKKTTPAKKAATPQKKPATPKAKPQTRAEQAAPVADAVSEPTSPEESLAALFDSTTPDAATAEPVEAALGEAAPLETEPITAEPIVEAEPTVEPEPVGEAEPIVEPEATVEAEPVVEAESAVEPEPIEADLPAATDIAAAVETPAVSTPEADGSISDAIVIRGLVKNFGDHRAVNEIDLTVRAGSFYGIVGPNGAGKTTTLSILAGLLRASAGQVVICGIDQATDPLAAKRVMGVLPDRLRTFDRLTGRQLLHYYGLLRGLAADVIEKRTADLARAFDLGDALNRVVSDYSAGMTKKIMLAGAMIHSPRVLVLDEPFEAVDPVSSAVILDILRAYVAHGGTVILSSHGMDLVERVCSRVAIIVDGDVLAEGTIDEVRAGQTLEARFVELSGGVGEVEGLEWLHTFSD